MPLISCHLGAGPGSPHSPLMNWAALGVAPPAVPAATWGNMPNMGAASPPAWAQAASPHAYPSPGNGMFSLSLPAIRAVYILFVVQLPLRRLITLHHRMLLSLHFAHLFF